MNRFRIVVGKEQVTFAAAHFITYGSGICERLHGHNYRLGAVMEGPLDRHHMVFDFVRLKRALEDIVAKLDHRMLVAADNPELPATRADGEVTVRQGDRRYVFPADEVAFLDVPNTTAEMLAAWVTDELLGRLGSGAEAVSSIEIEVEESPGQSAWCRRELPA